MIGNRSNLFEDETCKQYAGRRPDDIDLLVISRKVAGFSIESVGACLSLPRDEVRKVERGYERMQPCDKIHNLLIKWMDRNNCSTWSDLVHCLKCLMEPDDALMEGIRAYLHQKVPPITGNEMQVSIQFDQQRETSSAVEYVTNGPLESVTDGSLEACQASGFVPQGAMMEASTPECSLMSCYWHKLCVPCKKRNAHGPFDLNDIPVNLKVKQGIRAMNEKFAVLLMRTHQFLDASGVSPGSLQIYLTQLSVSTKEDIRTFSDSMAEIMSQSTPNQIFAFLSRIGAWSFLNFHLLESVVNRFGNQSLKDEVEEYSQQIQVFKRETKLVDFLRVWSGRTPYGTLPDRKPLIAKLNAKWAEYTLADLVRDEEYLASEFELEQHAFHFSNADKGCVCIMWLIPTSAVPLINKKNKQNLRNVLKLGVLDFHFKPESPRMLTSSCDPPRVKSKLDAGLNAGYSTLYEQSIKDPHTFWGRMAREFLVWDTPFKKVMDCNMEEGIIRWFTGGKLNVSVNCLDRHVKEDPERVAIIWEKDEPGRHVNVTYRELLDDTCRIANVLRRNGTKKGEVVVIYMSTTPLAVASMLACARIGAEHCVVFAAFDAEVLRRRILHAKAKVVITANSATIGGKVMPLRAKVATAVSRTPGAETLGVKFVLVATRTPDETVPAMSSTTDVHFIPLVEAMEKESPVCPPEPMDSEDRLFTLFTSGTSGRPKSITHTQAGYILHAAVVVKYVFDYKVGDIYACVTDLGWITSHTCVVYGPLCIGATTVLFESTATYPDYDRYWEMIDRLKIKQFSTTPAVIRLLMKAGDEYVKKHDLSSLTMIGTAGEPLNEDAWEWFNKVVGKERCVLLDMWGQTETGGLNITPLPAHENFPTKPGFAMKPLFGVLPVLVDDKGKEIHGNEVIGHLCIKQPLLAIGREVNGSQEELKKAYFTEFPGFFCTYDQAYRDKDGDYRIYGRIDDSIRIKAAWVNVPEIECFMNMSDSRVLETSLVGYKEEGSQQLTICAFLELRESLSEKEITAVIERARKAIRDRANIVVNPERFFVVNKQPKTQSGKIARRILRYVASDLGVQPESWLSDLEPVVVEEFIKKLGFPLSYYAQMTAENYDDCDM